MAMTNEQIIAAAMMMHGITEVCHTYIKWKELGYQVQKGSKAVFQANIWKHTTKKNDDGEEVGRMFMRKASFFSASQVKKIA